MMLNQTVSTIIDQQLLYPADFCNEYSMHQNYNFTNYNNYNDVPKIEYNVD